MFSADKRIIGWETETKLGTRSVWDQLLPDFEDALTQHYQAGVTSTVLDLFDCFYFANFVDMTWTDGTSGMVANLRPIFGVQGLNVLLTNKLTNLLPKLQSNLK